MYDSPTVRLHTGEKFHGDIIIRSQVVVTGIDQC